MHGPWTPEKGAKQAVSVVQLMSEGSKNEGDEEDAEAMSEFIALCQIRFGGAAG